MSAPGSSSRGIPQAHAGVAVDGRPWASRLMVVEVADLAALADDAERDPLADVVFPEPVIADRALAVSFERLHAALDSSATRLEATSGSRNGCAR